MATKTTTAPAPAKKVPAKKPAAGLRRVLYPEPTYRECWGEDALTAAAAMRLLGWETEDQYRARRLAADSKLKPETLVLEEGKLHDAEGKKVQPLLLTDLENNKVVCWNNCGNRPWDRSTSLRYAQDVLNHQWAGPTSWPQVEDAVYAGEEPWTLRDGTVLQPGDTFQLQLGTVNGEDVLIDWTGQVESGQHTLIGLIFAWQLWNGAKLKDVDNSARWQILWPKDRWPDGPVMERGVKMGISSLPKVVQTLDACRPRTEADVIATSGLFDAETQANRLLLSKMLSRMVGFLWERVSDKAADSTHVWRTHGELTSFIDRHGGAKGRLVKCLKTIFKLNEERKLSGMYLSPGACAGMLWLMASSDTDRAAYQLDKQGNPPTDKRLDWARLDEAETFWTFVAEGGKRVQGLLDVLNGDKFIYQDRDIGSMEERTAVLAKAWAAFKDGGTVQAGDCRLVEDDYGTTSEGKRFLLEAHDFGGIDLGPKTRVPILTPEEKEEAERQERERKAAEKVARVEAARKAKEAAAANGANADGIVRRVKGEAPAPTPVQYDADGKPPPPKAKPATRRQVEAEQTARAAAHDAEDSATQPAAPPPPPKPKGKLPPGSFTPTPLPEEAEDDDEVGEDEQE